MILDTSFLVDLMRGDAGAVQKLKELEKSKTAQCIAIPSFYEITMGIILSQKPTEDKRRALQVLASANVLSLDKDAAIRAVEIQERLIKEGMMADPEDAMTAGIALTKDQTILTKDIKSFSRIKGLRVQTY